MAEEEYEMEWGEDDG